MEKNEIEVTIDGKKVRYTTSKIDIQKLKYYPENPRVHDILSKYKNAPSQEEIEKELWALDSTKDLYRDILKNGGLIEPIIVKDNQVLEGNSRLRSYRKLFEDAKTNEEKDKWRYIPAVILGENISEKQIFQLLGTYHIRGKAQWKTYEKASYVYRMKSQFGMSEQEIAENISTTEADVKQMIDSYLTMKKEKVTDLSKFSHFMEFYKNRGLKKFRDQDPLFVKEFANLVKEDRIPRAEAVRELPRLLSDKKGKKSFIDEKEDFETAKAITYKRNPEHESKFLMHLKRVTEELKTAEIPRLSEELENGSKKQIVTRFIKEVEKFKKNLKL